MVLIFLNFFSLYQNPITFNGELKLIAAHSTCYKIYVIFSMSNIYSKRNSLRNLR